MDEKIKSLDNSLKLVEKHIRKAKLGGFRNSGNIYKYMSIRQSEITQELRALLKMKYKHLALENNP